MNPWLNCLRQVLPVHLSHPRLVGNILVDQLPVPMANLFRSLSSTLRTYPLSFVPPRVPAIFRHRRAIFLCCVIFLLLTITFWQLPRDHGPQSRIQDEPGPANPNRLPLGQQYPHRQTICQGSFDWLNELDIPFPVKYARRDIVVKPDPNVQRNSVTKIDEALFGNPSIVEPGMNSNKTGLPDCSEPLFLNVPAFADTPIDASHIIFGAATTLGRLQISLPYFERWLAHTNARLFVVITDKLPES